MDCIVYISVFFHAKEPIVTQGVGIIVTAILFVLIPQIRVADRPGGVEPRAIKRRPSLIHAWTNLVGKHAWRLEDADTLKSYGLNLVIHICNICLT